MPSLATINRRRYLRIHQAKIPTILHKNALIFNFFNLNFVNFIDTHFVTIRLRTPSGPKIMFAIMILNFMSLEWPEDSHIIDQNM